MQDPLNMSLEERLAITAGMKRDAERNAENWRKDAKIQTDKVKRLLRAITMICADEAMIICADCGTVLAVEDRDGTLAVDPCEKCIENERIEE